jgi:hypothetical protein
VLGRHMLYYLNPVFFCCCYCCCVLFCCAVMVFWILDLIDTDLQKFSPIVCVVFPSFTLLLASFEAQKFFIYVRLSLPIFSFGCL